MGAPGDKLVSVGYKSGSWSGGGVLDRSRKQLLWIEDTSFDWMEKLQSACNRVEAMTFQRGNKPPQISTTFRLTKKEPYMGVVVPAISNRVSDYTTGKESNTASKKIALNDVIFKMTGPNNEDFDSYKDAKTCSDQLDAWRKELKNEKNADSDKSITVFFTTPDFHEATKPLQRRRLFALSERFRQVREFQANTEVSM